MHKPLLALVAAAAAVVTVVSACSESPRAHDSPRRARRLSTAQKDSALHAKDSLLAQRARQLDEQSQLIGDAAASARLVSEIDRELSKVRGLSLDRAEPRAQRDSERGAADARIEDVGRKVRLLIARLDASEARVKGLRLSARRRAAADSAHALADSAQVAALAAYEGTIAELRGTVDRQRRELDSITVVVAALQAENGELAARSSALAARDDSVFVVMGSRKELLRKGIIREEGGTPLLFGRHGETLVAARELDAEDFRVLSKSRDLTIALPRSDRAYQIVTRQSLAHAGAAAMKNGLVQGELRIDAPEEFWAPSRFLILVER